MSENGMHRALLARRLRGVDDLSATRWRAVEEHDVTMVGVFVYAVSSTGVYCKPGCSSRRPLRRNVEFFATPGDAVGAGYRACRKCRPDQNDVLSPALASVVSLCRWLEEVVGDRNVAAFAAELGYSERHLRRRFSEVVGVPISSYLRALQAERARKALHARAPVTTAIYEAGYGSNRAFYEHGAPRLGMTPGKYRAGGRGERIAFTSLSTPIGVVVAASTVRGVCAVHIGPDEASLEASLVTEFPNATLERDDEGLAWLIGVLAGAVRGETNAAVLPLDLEGTAFQTRVWEALRAIPDGHTLSYSQVAVKIGAPGAVRAVGSACGANPAALVVPCHRVVRLDGSLGGYRWGIAVKQALLDAEAGGRRT
jgi:AraC family transcriptional regulator of adaptative response/methylated-DNA-[protein]-cysteine methyltransferase